MASPKEAYPEVWQDAWIKSREEYEVMYKRSIEDPNGFWREIAVKDYYWETEPDQEHCAWNFDVNKVGAGQGQGQGLGRAGPAQMCSAPLHKYAWESWLP